MASSRAEALSRHARSYGMRHISEARLSGQSSISFSAFGEGTRFLGDMIADKDRLPEPGSAPRKAPIMRVALLLCGVLVMTPAMTVLLG